MKIIGKCKTFSFISFLFLVVIGTLWHYAYRLTGNNSVIAAITPVNESVWEHLKILLFPALILSAAEFFIYGRNTDKFLAAKGIAILVGMCFIVTAFYTYSGICGGHFLLGDIAIFVISAAISSFLTCYLICNDTFKPSETLSAVVLTIITVFVILFIYFTYTPPHNELFRDPISEDFGITTEYKNKP